MRSVKQNFVLNFLRNSVNVLYPIITFPYLSRILQPEGMGKIDFVSGLAGYFGLIAGLGIPLYGVREIARHRDDQLVRNEVFSDLLTISLIATVFAYLLAIPVFMFSNKVRTEYLLFFITMCSVFSDRIGVEWFFQGIEKYGYITIRSIFFKILAIVLILVFVKKQDDYVICATITMFTVLGANLSNIIYSRHFVQFKLPDIKALIRHIKPTFIIFSMNFAINIYVGLDAVLLGYLSTSRAVGLYGASVKLNRLIIVLINSLGTVMMPRLAYYIKHNQVAEYKEMASKSLSFIFFITLPATAGLMLLAPEIIYLFSGESFMDAVSSMRIISPIIIFLAITNFTGIQILYTKGKETVVLISVVAGAAVCLLLNFLLVPHYAHTGAAFANCASEFTVMFVQIILGYRYFGVPLFRRRYFNYIIATVVMVIATYFVNRCFTEYILSLFVSVGVGVVAYLGALLLMKDEFLLHDILGSLKK